MSRRLSVAAAAAPLVLAACSSLGGGDLPKKAPPLADMEEPVALLAEPKDEAQRRTLPLGSFTGITAAEARRTLDEGEPAAPGVRVARVTENSPADAAGIEEDDLLLAASWPGAAEREIRWPSEWRKVELDVPAGTALRVIVDRAGEERTADVRTVARVRQGERMNGDRYREEQRVGVVLRTPTEVEARAAGLGPGGGAVVVGLSAASPWRAAGVRFGDLVASIDGRAVGHPQQVLEAIRGAAPGARLDVELVHGAGGPADAVTRRTESLAVSRREKEVRRVSIPLVYSYESERGMTETSFLAGVLRTRSTAAAWELRLLWLIELSGGDADELVEVAE